MVLVLLDQGVRGRHVLALHVAEPPGEDRALRVVLRQPVLREIGDDAQLANIDLQNALQKQQQTLQTISNVSKMLHDTAMAIVRPSLGARAVHRANWHSGTPEKNAPAPRFTIRSRTIANGL